MTLTQLANMSERESQQWFFKATLKEIKAMLKAEGYKGYSKYTKATIFDFITPILDKLKSHVEPISKNVDQVVEKVVEVKEVVVEKVVEKLKVIATPMFFFAANPKIGGLKDLKREYRKWSKLLHPDTSELSDDGAFKRMKLEYEAHLYLLNYDEYEDSFKWLCDRMLDI